MKGLSLCVTAALVCLGIFFSQCNFSSRTVCHNKPLLQTGGIYFYLKDRVTGFDLLSYGASVLPAPDSVKLINITTGQVYPLLVTKGSNGSILFSALYKRPAGITDSLEFRFGQAVPDTLIVSTGLIKGWRGDECPTVNDAGIKKVVLRNTVLLETTDDNSIFTLMK